MISQGWFNMRVVILPILKYFVLLSVPIPPEPEEIGIFPGCSYFLQGVGINYEDRRLDKKKTNSSQLQPKAFTTSTKYPLNKSTYNIDNFPIKMSKMISNKELYNNFTISLKEY